MRLYRISLCIIQVILNPAVRGLTNWPNKPTVVTTEHFAQSAVDLN